MKIQSIRIQRVEPRDDNFLRAYATIAIMGGGLTIVINTIRVLRDRTGKTFVAWPNRKVHGIPRQDGVRTHDGPDGPFWYSDTAHPADAATREHFDRAILGAYRIAVLSGQDRYEYTGGPVTRRAAAVAV